ncbi:MAG: 30S ribosomal protein S8 [Parcubacteria group bacterium 21-54-25]|nr:MAG: 30S ribosomal protein S8 [Parcubacteria group bacterium 21-54-25]HQU08255.1 30S ribosomal protein S8 [Candidatus Paceibacterota bacterium]
MVSDRVGDFIIRLKNASAVKRTEVAVPYSKQLEAIAKKLRELGFVGMVEKMDERTLRVTLAYDTRGVSRIRNVRRLSKPGRRLYVSHRGVHTVAGGTGARILSTPQGVLSDAEARRARVGGESLFEIW